MKTLSRVLAMCLCVAPVVDMGAWAVVATTSGHNLTAYNPSNAYNNQWASATNGRQDAAANNQWASATNGRQDAAAPTAKADFGNCNSLIARCAQPKCANGGCSDLNVATNIVAGCVQMNKTCEQYGNELVSYMAAQLVASSTAKVNAQNAAAAQSAAAEQNQQTQQQMQKMQQQMQSQLSQLQQQNQQTQQQLQRALQQQQQQNEELLKKMSATTTQNTVVSSNAGTTETRASSSDLSGYQMEAIERGVSAQVLERQNIAKEVENELKEANTALNKVKTVMNNSFEYAGCDSRGNNCKGPKRIKKWRELAIEFVDPYDSVVDKLYDAIENAMFNGGIDLSDIYMMLDDSCQRWGEYMCQGGGNNEDLKVTYIKSANGQSSTPYVCKSNSAGRPQDYGYDYDQCITVRNNTERVAAQKSSEYEPQTLEEIIQDCKRVHGCTQCQRIGIVTDKQKIYKLWTEEDLKDGNSTIIACADGAVVNNGIFKRRAKKQNAASMIDVDTINSWLSQTEPSSGYANESCTTPGTGNKVGHGQNYNYTNWAKCYCSVKQNTDVKKDGNGESILRKAALSRALDEKDAALCINALGKPDKANEETCPYINPIYAICDTYAYNAGNSENPTDSSERDRVKEIVGLKVTVLSQQLYRQYEYLAATLRRLQTQLRRALSLANLEAAGASSDGGSSGSASNDSNIVINGAQNCLGFYEYDQFVSCLQTNIALINGIIDSDPTKACQQLQATYTQAKDRFKMEMSDKTISMDNSCGEFEKKNDKYNKCKTDTKSKQKIRDCANTIIAQAGVIKKQLDREDRKYDR